MGVFEGAKVQRCSGGAELKGLWSGVGVVHV